MNEGNKIMVNLKKYIDNQFINIVFEEGNVERNKMCIDRLNSIIYFTNKIILSVREDKKDQR